MAALYLLDKAYSQSGASKINLAHPLLARDANAVVVDFEKQWSTHGYIAQQANKVTYSTTRFGVGAGMNNLSMGDNSGVYLEKQVIQSTNKLTTIFYGVAGSNTEEIGISWVQNASLFGQYSLGLAGAGRKPRLEIRTTLGTFISALGTTSPASGDLVHIVGTFDGSNAKIYLNGKLENTTAYSGSIASSTQQCVFLRHNQLNSTNFSWGGAAFYGIILPSTVITAEDVLALSHNPWQIFKGV